jgi:hypothetical protein
MDLIARRLEHNGFYALNVVKLSKERYITDHKQARNLHLEVKLVLMGGAQEIQESGLERWSRMESAEASSEYHLSLPRDCQPPILASNNRQ